MATEENQTQIRPPVAQHTSPSSTGNRPGRETKHPNNGQETWRCSDQFWHSKQRSSPSLLLYRKLSCDSGKGTNLDEEYECFHYSSKVQSTETELSTDKNTEEKTPEPGKCSEGSLCQLNTHGDSVDAGKRQSIHYGCTLSSLYTSQITYCCHSSRSSPSPSSSPVNSPRPSCPHKRHIRRGSLPVSMLAFHKVIKQR